MSDWEKVKISLEDKRYKWRTMRGVTEETGLSQKEVQELMSDHSDTIIKSSIPAESGEDLFTTRDHFRKMQSPFVKIASSLINRVSSSSNSGSEDI